jgi:predicted NAD/FAD-binding protein
MHSAQIVESMRAPVAEYLRNVVMNGSRVVVKLNGMSDYATVQGFVKVFSQSLTELRETGQVTMKDGTARFDAVVLGTAETVAASLSGKTYKGKKISVTGVTGNTLEISVAR